MTLLEEGGKSVGAEIIIPLCEAPSGGGHQTTRNAFGGRSRQPRASGSAVGTNTGHRAVDRRLDRIAAIKLEIWGAQLPMNLDDAIERWAWTFQRDIRTIRSDVRVLLGEAVEANGKREGGFTYTRMIAGKRLIGTQKTFRNREQDLYGKANKKLGEYS